MVDWPEQAFDQLNLFNPYLPNLMAIRREAVHATQGMSGTVVECGVFRGRSLATLAWLLEEGGDPRRVLGFDSFEGFPAPAPQDMVGGRYVDAHKKEYFADTSIDQVRTYLTQLVLGERVTLTPGFFADSLPKVPIDAISVLVLDCDLYESYDTCLRCLYPLVEAGGWIVFDEYYSPGKYPGARIAVDEFFADKPESPTLAEHLLAEDDYERWYVVKE